MYQIWVGGSARNFIFVVDDVTHNFLKVKFFSLLAFERLKNNNFTFFCDKFRVVFIYHILAINQKCGKLPSIYRTLLIKLGPTNLGFATDLFRERTISWMNGVCVVDPTLIYSRM